jgi:hypothetical protein
MPSTSVARVKLPASTTAANTFISWNLSIVSKVGIVMPILGHLSPAAALRQRNVDQRETGS